MYTLNKIIALTESQGKSQKELTDYLGLKRGTFTAWKAGHNSSYKKRPARNNSERVMYFLF